MQNNQNPMTQNNSVPVPNQPTQPAYGYTPAQQPVNPYANPAGYYNNAAPAKQKLGAGKIIMIILGIILTVIGLFLGLCLAIVDYDTYQTIGEVDIVIPAYVIFVFIPIALGILLIVLGAKRKKVQTYAAPTVYYPPASAMPVVQNTTAVQSAPVAAASSVAAAVAAPVVAQAAPVVAETAPVVAETAPVVTETAPVVAETAPVAAETAPVVAETAPVVAQAAPVVAETAPVVAETAPVVAETAPVEAASAVAAPVATGNSVNTMTYDYAPTAAIQDQSVNLGKKQGRNNGLGAIAIVALFWIITIGIMFASGYIYFNKLIILAMILPFTLSATGLKSNIKSAASWIGLVLGILSVIGYIALWALAA